MNHFTELSKIKSYLITIPENNTSLKKTLDDLQSINIIPTVLTTERDFENGSRGCYQSHQKALQTFLETNENYALIFEDDAELYERYSIWPQIENFIKNTEFDILCLGCHFSSAKKVSSNIYKLDKFAEMHAYLVSRQGAKKIIQWNYNGIPYDIEFTNKNMEVYGINPSLFLQQLSHASTGANNWDFRYYVASKGLKFLLRWERYTWEHYHLSSQIFFALIIGFIVTGILYLRKLL